MPDEDRIRAALLRSTEGSSDFDLNPGIRLAEGRVLRAAAVLVPIVLSPRGSRVILTKRSSDLKHHPGQVAFPGGKIDAGDGTPERAALREAEEEIALHPNRVELAGRLPDHETVTGFTVTPVVGFVRGPVDLHPEAGEVAEIFSVPLDHVTNRENFLIEKRLWRGTWRRYYVVPWGPYYIWGATARILRGLAERMQP